MKKVSVYGSAEFLNDISANLVAVCFKMLDLAEMLLWRILGHFRDT